MSAPPGSPSGLGPLLREVAAVGPYFAVRPEQPPPGAFPLAEVYAGGPGGPLARAVRTTAARMGTAETRVAASTLHLGITARLWSVALGAAVLGGVVPDLGATRTFAAFPEGGGPVELWLPDPVPWTGCGAASGDSPSGDLPSGAVLPLARALHAVVADGHLVPLARAVRNVTAIAPGLLRGNAASALAGAAQVLRARSGARADTAFALTGHLLGHGHLRGAGTWRAEPPAFRRASCCLYYRAAPGAGVCGDCVFTSAPPAPRRTLGGA